MINPFAWIRDMFGIGKDAEERKKTILETEALEAEKRERESQIQRATLEDIQKYVPSAKEIERIAGQHKCYGFAYWLEKNAFLALGWLKNSFPVLGCLLILAAVAAIALLVVKLFP